jgi:hypothetical protein
VARLSWSLLAGADCIRLRGLAAGADVQVRPAGAAAAGLPAGDLPAMAGRLAPDGADACFVPRFGFVDGTAYAVTVDGAAAGVLTRPRAARPATAQVLAIDPAAGEVPRNLLRCYVWFSAPMSEGYAAGHVWLADDAGMALPGALLSAEQELWDAGRRRLTVLLDPARIKRGLAGHRAAGYPLPGSATPPGPRCGPGRSSGTRSAPTSAAASSRATGGWASRPRAAPSRWS